MTDSRRTEQPGPCSQLDLLSPLELTRTLIDDQLGAVQAVQAAAEALARAAEAAATRLAAGGRLIYAGAGTSGRLATLDATELSPTFGWPSARAVACLAGGLAALTQAVEGAEDDVAAAQQDLQAAHLSAQDVLVVLAASGTTPYALSALAYGKEVGALRVAFANNPGTPLLSAAEHPILLDTGPEVISGSTRLKAGSAQKMALNTFSSAVMVRLGKVYGNLMIDVQSTNAKLRARALRLTVLGSGADEDAAQRALAAAGGQVKLAVVMLRLGLSAPRAQACLDAAGGQIRAALGEKRAEQ